jgi:hypothetical protein
VDQVKIAQLGVRNCFFYLLSLKLLKNAEVLSSPPESFQTGEFKNFYGFITVSNFKFLDHITENYTRVKSLGSSVGRELGYRLDDRGSRVRFPVGAGNFALHHRVQNGSGAHPASYPVNTGGTFPGDKAADARSWPLTSI